MAEAALSEPGQPAPTVAAALSAATRRLRAAEVAEPRLDASVLLAAALEEDRARLWGRDERRLTAAQVELFQDYVEQRAARRPVAQIVGQREFWSLSFAVSAAVLDPRPDSETLIEAALASVVVRNQPLRVLDLGTGSGCLLLALLSELPAATGVGVDISPAALAVAAGNAARLGLRQRCDLVVGDWSSPLVGGFDIVLSNPPYLSEAELSQVAPEVRLHEPTLALDGGVDGLSAYRALLPGLPALLRPGGRVFLECGAAQADALGEMLVATGLGAVERYADLAEHTRCLAAATAS
tara:strand:+ start:179 stop:1066 length:888 start_codon:yes stop_codon:yes gene_type:complete